MSRALGHVEYHLLGIAKGWIKGVNTYPQLINSLVQAYNVEYCDLSKRIGLAEKSLVQRWLELNEQYKLFNLLNLIENMEPERNWYHGFPNISRDSKEYRDSRKALFSYDPLYDAGYYGNWLKAITSNLGGVEVVKLPGFREWLVKHKYDVRSTVETM